MSVITPIRTPAEAGLIDLYKVVRNTLPGTKATLKHRDEAFAVIEAAGLPHRRVEDWKYTDLRNLMQEAPPLAARPHLAETDPAIAKSKAFAAVSGARVTFVNGHLVTTEAIPEGVEVTPLAEALTNGHPLLARMGGPEVARDNAAVALNSAFVADGAIIAVADGVTLEEPLVLRFINTGTKAFATSPRVVLAMGDGAALTLVESHEGPGGVGYHSNSVVEIVAGSSVDIAHIRLNAEGDRALALSTLMVTLGADAKFASTGVVAGGHVSRHQVFLAFAGERSVATIGGATMLAGKSLADTTLVVDHRVPGCQSRELFKTVVDGEATGVFQGKIIVRQHAQKTDGQMMSAALLLSEGAAMNNKPELEIFADDVVCAHGATCGQLDDELLFYLMARGLPRPEAEALLVQAFLGEALEPIALEDVREELTDMVASWLAGRAG
ncbi:Fe-S cluster assembly protein SufD [Chelatococcus asaccharovorans]|uniref:Fe-S cluster assembly protein SufD n=1 Tax=Chelatococcus asaccharovorans TaxID=28210 RepID=A0A2V3UCL8_9HYPH|nr:Fe-S cluster assembly protein SufD [Chelatococcus asaccharovorans]MBS7703536.1 Fe-S cluster assembly protein SufD [Chelatococcus asaccharovorans]PXW61878.1 Fe-S cluster assembly protein SufD [Chelatococcus asaccharovorans]